MPMYEYRCRKCKTVREEFRRMADRERGGKCPRCGGILKVLFPTSVGLKIWNPNWTVPGPMGEPRTFSSREEFKRTIEKEGFVETNA